MKYLAKQHIYYSQKNGFTISALQKIGKDNYVLQLFKKIVIVNDISFNFSPPQVC